MSRRCQWRRCLRGNGERLVSHDCLQHFCTTGSWSWAISLIQHTPNGLIRCPAERSLACFIRYGTACRAQARGKISHFFFFCRRRVKTNGGHFIAPAGYCGAATSPAVSDATLLLLLQELISQNEAYWWVVVTTAILAEIHHRSPQGHSITRLYREAVCVRARHWLFKCASAWGFITIAQRLQLQGVNRKLCGEQSGARSVMINDTDALCWAWTASTGGLMRALGFVSLSTGWIIAEGLNTIQ